MALTHRSFHSSTTNGSTENNKQSAGGSTSNNDTNVAISPQSPIAGASPPTSPPSSPLGKYYHGYRPRLKSRFFQLLQLGLCISLSSPLLCILFNKLAWQFSSDNLSSNNVVEVFPSYGFLSSAESSEWQLELSAMVYIPANNGNIIKTTTLRLMSNLLSLFGRYNRNLAYKRLAVFFRDFKRGKMVDFEVCNFDYEFDQRQRQMQTQKTETELVNHQNKNQDNREKGREGKGREEGEEGNNKQSLECEKIVGGPFGPSSEGGLIRVKTSANFNLLTSSSSSSSSSSSTSSSVHGHTYRYVRVSRENDTHSSTTTTSPLSSTSLNDINNDGVDRGAHVHLVGYRGVSVISDIDDTIKVTGVGSIPQVLENTLVNPFQALPGMAIAYRKWMEGGSEIGNSHANTISHSGSKASATNEKLNAPHIHYVSSSPWPFAGSLYDWMMKENFPPGSMHLKSFRLELFEPWGIDVTVFNLIRNPFKYKTTTISQIIDNFPGRKFVLVGDSSEKDPEIYANIAKLYPSQVACIMIRNVTNHPISKQKMDHVFKDLPKGSFTTYKLDVERGTSEFQPKPLHEMASTHSCAMT